MAFPGRQEKECDAGGNDGPTRMPRNVAITHRRFNACTKPPNVGVFAGGTGTAV